uniref:Uncharacterized mitochondrial protein AtMg00810-like n=1 Tax=Tanacetum cinerariifolium TaxID=118510 RepID=A0A6L2NEA2_TANCI|nr:uncharacterized mitochondrial protein AtMg00810-like [Tanacetum cinerariifolium]
MSLEEVTEEKVKEIMQLVLIKEVYAEALQVKHPIIDWKVELNRMYEPDKEDQLWTYTQNFMHAPVDWKLYESCRVHHITSKDKQIFMLVEKDYPLRKGLALVMICYKLQLENFLHMANDLVLKGRIVGNKMHKAFPLPVMEFPLAEQLPTATAPRTALAAQAPQILQTPTASTTVADTTPTPKNSSLLSLNIPNSSHDVDGLPQQQHVQQQDNQAPLQPKTIVDNIPNAMSDGDVFENPFASPSTSAAESSSLQYVDPSNMHMFYRPYHHDYQNVKEAMNDSAWIDLMQEELLQFKTLDSNYVLEILTKYGIETCDPIGTPMEIKYKLDLDKKGTLVDATKYQSMIGALMYLTSSRSDIVHATCLCAWYQAQPTEKHLKEVKRIFRYLRRTINMGLWYTKDSSFELTEFSDADYGRCKTPSRVLLVELNFRRKDSGLVIKETRLHSVVNRESRICVFICFLCPSPLDADTVNGLWLSLYLDSYLLLFKVSHSHILQPGPTLKNQTHRHLLPFCLD